MTRHIMALAVLMCATATPLFGQLQPTSGQPTQLTVTSVSADVHKFPSVGSPIVGTAPRGTVLAITRDIGHWMKVSWPASQDGIGYVHVSAGSIARAMTPSAASPTAATGAASGALETRAQPAGKIAIDPEPERGRTMPSQSPRASTYVVLPAHTMGFGGGINSSGNGFKGSARRWFAGGFGIQFEASREELTSALSPERVSSMQFAPSVIYALPDTVSNYLWVRPYVGGGASMYRSTLDSGASAAARPTESGMDVQAFGGGEFTLANVPRLTLSADLAYRRPRTPFGTFETKTFTLSVAGHWYVK